MSSSRDSQVTGIFSATIPDTVEQLSRTFLKDPVRVTVGERNATASNIKQQLLFAGSEEGKILLLQQLLTEGLKAPVLIFVASKEKAVFLQRWTLFGEPGNCSALKMLLTATSTNLKSIAIACMSWKHDNESISIRGSVTSAFLMD